MAWFKKLFEKIFGARCQCAPTVAPKRKRGRPRKINVGS